MENENLKENDENSKKEDESEISKDTTESSVNKNQKYECEGCGRKYFTFNEAEKCEGTHDCCAKRTEKRKGFWSGLIYGLVPHTFCILFIIASILGATFAASLFKPFLLNRNFFYILIAASFIFATFSAMFYLKRNNCLCLSGARKKWKFLSILYTTTIGINILFFLVIFPAVANLSSVSATGAAVSNGVGLTNTDLSKYPSLTLDVDIPCSGHAPLITGELKKVNGVLDVKYQSGKFNVIYDSAQTSKEKILLIDIFKTYPATVMSESSSSGSLSTSASGSPSATTSGGCCGGGGGCGGSGGSCGV